MYEYITEHLICMDMHAASNICMNIYRAFIKCDSYAFIIYGVHDLVSWISTPAVRHELRNGQTPILIEQTQVWNSQITWNSQLETKQCLWDLFPGPLEKDTRNRFVSSQKYNVASFSYILTRTKASAAPITKKETTKKQEEIYIYIYAYIYVYMIVQNSQLYWLGKSARGRYNNKNNTWISKSLN